MDVNSEFQRIHQWYNNRRKQGKNSSASQMNSKHSVKTLMKRQALQLWQAFSVLNTEVVKQQVDSKYPEYVAEVLGAGGKKIMERLSFHRLICMEMYEESNEEMKEMVQKRMKDDTLDMPEYLVEAQETQALGEEEAKRYFLNYRRQM